MFATVTRQPEDKRSAGRLAGSARRFKATCGWTRWYTCVQKKELPFGSPSYFCRYIGQFNLVGMSTSVDVSIYFFSRRFVSTTSKHPIKINMIPITCPTRALLSPVCGSPAW